MSKINLTPKELREFARLEARFRLTLWSSEREWTRWEELTDRVGKRSLAMALADAMEERDELKRRLETAGKVCCDLVEERGKLRADLEAAREKLGGAQRCIRAVTFRNEDGEYEWAKAYGSGFPSDVLVPAVRAAWEGK